MKLPRRGFTLFDALGALVIALVLAVIVSQAIVATAQQGRMAEQRRIATQELANAMEQATAVAWKEMTPERFAAIPLSPIAEQVLPTAKLRIAADDVAGPPVARKITVEITWKIGPDEATSPLRLVAWKYEPREDAP